MITVLKAVFHVLMLSLVHSAILRMVSICSTEYALATVVKDTEETQVDTARNALFTLAVNVTHLWLHAMCAFILMFCITTSAMKLVHPIATYRPEKRSANLVHNTVNTASTKTHAFNANQEES